MNRRAFLKTSGAAALLPLTPGRLASQTAFRRVRPSDRGWPSKEAWKRLKDAVEGNLIPVEFPLAACKAGANSEESFETFHFGTPS